VISLHSSEGFGRGMAEAQQLGCNTGCWTGPLAHPVRCQDVSIPRGAYPAPMATAGANLPGVNYVGGRLRS